MTTIADSDDHLTAVPGDRELWLEPVKAFAVFVIIQISLVVGDVTPFFNGMLAEPDAYMRLNRVAHLWESGAWFDSVYPRIGAPDGHVQHWTRPMDLLLLIGAAIAAPFVGFDAGLHWWGVMIGPMLQLPAVLALVWAAAPLIRRDSLWLVGILFVVQPGALLTFLVGRPDQNCLLITLFVLMLGLAIRMLLQPDRLRFAALAGLVTALALWVSVETMLVTVVAIAVPGMYWLFGDRRLAPALLVHAGSLFVCLLASLLLERGIARFAIVEFDMISTAHLVLFGLNALFWAVIMLATEKWRLAERIPGRAVVAAVSAIAVFTILWLTQPGFFESPFARVDDLYRSLRLIHIEEFQPVVRWSTLDWANAAKAISKLSLWLGAVLIAAPSLVWLIRTRRGVERRAWVLLAILAAIFVPFTLMQIRWVAYAQTVLVIPYAMAIGAGIAWIGRQRISELSRALARVLGVSLACVWPFAPGTALAVATAEDEPKVGPMETGGTCPLVSLAGFLAEPDGLGDRPRRLMAFVDFGPELLYRTPHSVYSIPNHRLQPGFTATVQVMTAPGADEARALILENGVELIAVCPDWRIEAQFYGGAAHNPDGFYNELAAGTPPDFLEAVPLPDHVGRHFRLFSVTESAGSP